MTEKLISKKNYYLTMVQFLRPNAKKRVMYIAVSEEYFKKAKDILLSCEVDSMDNVIIYGRYRWESPENEMIEIAKNNPTDPQIKLYKLIDDLNMRKKAIKPMC